MLPLGLTCAVLAKGADSAEVIGNGVLACSVTSNGLLGNKKPGMGTDRAAAGSSHRCTNNRGKSIMIRSRREPLHSEYNTYSRVLSHLLSFPAHTKGDSRQP